MTEKEKMLNGLLYNASSDKELFDERVKCKEFCFEYNNFRPSENDEKKELIKKLFGKIGDNFLIEPNFYCDYGYNIEVGNNFYSNHNLVILDVNKVTIGDNVFFGPNVGVYTAGHPIEYAPRIQGLEFGKPITIGNNVWIGGNVVILPGVIIGDNTVIGAGSIVTKDIPQNVVAAGNPCRIIKNINE